MKPTRQLHDLDESLWLDNITRYLVNSRTLKHRMDELSVIYPNNSHSSRPTGLVRAFSNDRLIEKGGSKGEAK
jgi:transaldolase